MSNLSFVIHDDSGNIVQYGNCPSDCIDLQGSTGRNVLEGEGTCDNHYVLNGVITEYTATEIQNKTNLSQGFIWKMPERIVVDTRAVTDAQQEAWNKIKNIRTEKINSPFSCDGLMYDSNKTNIMGAVQMAVLSQLAKVPYSIEWTLFDNTTTILDAASMIKVGTALGMQVSNIYDIASGLRSDIEKAGTVPDVDKIAWPVAT